MRIEDRGQPPHPHRGGDSHLSDRGGREWGSGLRAASRRKVRSDVGASSLTPRSDVDVV